MPLILKYATASTGATSGSPAFYLRGIKKRKKKNAGVRMPPAVFAYVKKFSDDAGREI